MQQPDIPVLVGPWQDLRNPDQAIARQVHDLTRELLAELAHGHPLHGAPFTIIGRSYVRDDVLLETPHGWALVHLTWTRNPEPPPYPSTRFFDTAAAVEAAIDLDT
ncbi:hypothetical protein [Actinopolymorpha pittospori]